MDDNVIILIRHGERIDRSDEIQRANKYDPELTKKGNELAKNVGIQIAEEFKPYINKNGIKILSSPFTRALETALSLRNEISEVIKDKEEQELIIIKDIGEWNQQGSFPYDVYPTLLYFNNGKEERETKLYDEIISKKMSLKNVKYNIKYEDYKFVKFPETQKEADDRYENILCKVLDKIKNKTGNLFILVAHGETIYAMNKFLLEKIRQTVIRNKLQKDDPKSQWPDFLNTLNGCNQKYCNSLCYKITPEGDVSYYKTIIPTNL